MNSTSNLSVMSFSSSVIERNNYNTSSFHQRRRVSSLSVLTVAQRFLNDSFDNLRQSLIFSNFSRLIRNIHFLSIQHAVQVAASSTTIQNLSIWNVEFWYLLNFIIYVIKAISSTRDNEISSTVNTRSRSLSFIYLFDLKARSRSSFSIFRQHSSSFLTSAISLTFISSASSLSLSILRLTFHLSLTFNFTVMINDVNVIKMKDMSIESMFKLLISKNWIKWNWFIHDYLIFNNLNIAMIENVINTSTLLQKTVMLKVFTVLKHICEHIVYDLIKDLNNVSDIFDKLKRNYESEEKKLLNELRREFLSLKLKNFKDVNAYVDEFRRCIKNLTTHKITLSKLFLILMFKMRFSSTLQFFLIIWELNNKTVSAFDVTTAILNQLIVEIRNA